MRKKLNIVYYTCLLMLCAAINVHAYIDPSVTTYAIQAIAGVLIGLSAFINVYWRKVARKFKVDNAYQEIESDHLRFADPKLNRIIEVGKDIVDPVAVGKSAQKAELIKDVLLALSVSFALIYLVFTYGPIEIYAHNSNEFWFDIYIMMRSLVPVFFLLMAFAILFLLILRMFSRKCFFYICSFNFAVSLILYIQGNFLVYNMPGMDGTTVEWGQYVPDMLISAILTILVFAFVLAGSKFLKERFRTVMTVATGLISAVLVVTTISIPFTTNVLNRKLHYIVTDNDNMKLGVQKNFVILLLDAVDSRIVQQLMEQDPEFYQSAFEDFMYYPDTCGAYSFTQEAVPFIMNGKWFENQEDYFDFERIAMKESPLLKTLEEQNYKIDYYDHDLLYITEEEDMDRFRNVYHYDTRFTSSWKYTLVQLRLTMFKYAPFYLKPAISYDLKSFPDLRDIPEGMKANSFYYSDVNLYHQLQDEGFSVDPDVQNDFKFYHLDGAHVPFEYDEDLNIIESGTGTYEIDVKVSMKVADEFIKELKESGKYDDTAVIIMADHGYADQTLKERINPLLMIKGFNEHHAFIVSKAPISFDDLQDLYTRLLDGKTGDEQFTWKEGDQRIRRFIGYLYTKEYEMTEYNLEGNASTLDNFYPTGRVFILGQ